MVSPQRKGQVGVHSIIWQFVNCFSSVWFCVLGRWNCNIWTTCRFSLVQTEYLLQDFTKLVSLNYAIYLYHGSYERLHLFCIMLNKIALAIFRIGFVHIGRVGSVLITVSISIERYCSVCHKQTSNFGSYFLLPISILFSLLYNIPKFFELIPCAEENETQSNQATNETLQSSKSSYNISLDKYENIDNYYTLNHTIESFCDPNGIKATPLRKNSWYIIFYTVLSKLLFVELIPWITVIVLNYCTWRQLKEFHAARERTFGSNVHGKVFVLWLLDTPNSHKKDYSCRSVLS